MKKKRFLGIGFADSMKEATGGLSGLRYKSKQSQQISNLLLLEDPVIPQDKRVSAWRLVPLRLFIIIGCTLVIARLFQMQIVEGQNMRNRSNANRLLVKTIHAPRGIIYDRNHVPLVQNTPAFVRIGTNSATLVSYDDALAIEATSAAQADLEVQAVRQYPFGPILAHVIGYTSEISKEEFANTSIAKAYRLGDRVGRAGLEQTYETDLRGEDGATYYEVDALHNTTRQVGEEPAIQGKSLSVTLDLTLQKKAYDELSAALQKLHLQAGVVIASRPKTGEILALVSLPSYDNNLFSKRVDSAVYQSLLNDPNRPFFNRAIAGVYPPGSIFKIVTATAGLLTHKLDATTQIEDTGIIRLGQYTFANWMFLSSGRTEGMIGLTRAIARSNDIFFYKVGEMVGPDALANAAHVLGLGKKTGIDLPSEAAGLVPTQDWKQSVRNEIWYPGDTYHMAIGQGDNLVTPIQLNMLTNLIANNGYAFKPQLVASTTDEAGKQTNLLPSSPQISDILPTKDLQLIREGMHQACSTGGTGWPFFDFGISVPQLTGASSSAQVKQPIEIGCKTGTAELGGAEDKTHAWFTIFAPYNNPEISVTVLVEQGGEGSDIAAPIAKNILTDYFSNQLAKK